MASVSTGLTRVSDAAQATTRPLLETQLEFEGPGGGGFEPVVGEDAGGRG